MINRLGLRLHGGERGQALIVALAALAILGAATFATLELQRTLVLDSQLSYERAEKIINTMEQLRIACNNYKNSNNGNWPPNLEAVRPWMDDATMAFLGPSGVDAQIVGSAVVLNNVPARVRRALANKANTTTVMGVSAPLRYSLASTNSDAGSLDVNTYPLPTTHVFSLPANSARLRPIFTYVPNYRYRYSNVDLTVSIKLSVDQSNLDKQCRNVLGRRLAYQSGIRRDIDGINSAHYKNLGLTGITGLLLDDGGGGQSHGTRLNPGMPTTPEAGIGYPVSSADLNGGYPDRMDAMIQRFIDVNFNPPPATIGNINFSGTGYVMMTEGYAFNQFTKPYFNGLNSTVSSVRGTFNSMVNGPIAVIVNVYPKIIRGGAFFDIPGIRFSQNIRGAGNSIVIANGTPVTTFGIEPNDQVLLYVDCTVVFQGLAINTAPVTAYCTATFSQP